MAGDLGTVVIKMLPTPLLKAALTDGPEWEALGRRILQRAKEMCPVSSDDRNSRPGNLGSGASDGGEHLVDTMEVRFIHGPDPRIGIGSTLTRGDQNVSALGLIELGTEPHPIPGNPVLAFEWKGQQVFFASVQHPGSPANPFVQRAMQRIVQEAGGVAVSA